MNTGWSFYISVFTIVNIFACLWLLWWTRRKRPSGAPAAEDPMATTGHVWDGDLREYNKPLPRWWLNLFYLTIVFSLGYLVFYPGLGNFAGTGRWTSADEHAADQTAAAEKLRPIFARFAATPLDALSRDPEALKLGRSVFANNCATCHGADARGAKGYPNLTDHDWIWGGEPDTVLKTITEGRIAAMPAWGQALGDQGVTATAVYVQSLSGRPADAALVAEGQTHYQTLCVACHGPDGKGNPALGAPNLTDNIWLYGGDFDTLVATIRNGRAGQMPAHAPLIGNDRVRVVAAWVLAQSQGEASTAETPAASAGR